MKSRLIILFAVISWSTVIIPASAVPDNGSPKDIFIVANGAVPVAKLSPSDVKEIFLKQKTHWPGGLEIVPFNAKSIPRRDDFRKRVLEMTAAEEAAYWRDLKKKSGVLPPLEFQDIQKAVFRMKGSIGYVYRGDFTAGVSKVLLVIP